MPAHADRMPIDGEILEPDDESLGAWAESIARRVPDPPVRDHAAQAAITPEEPVQRQPPRRVKRHTALKTVIASGVFAISMVLGTSLFLFQSRPDLLANRATMMVMQSVIAFVVVILLALTLFRLMALDRSPPQPHRREHDTPLPGMLAGIGDTMDQLAERSIALEERLSILSRQLEWNARKNVSALQNGAAAVEQHIAAIEQSGAAANDVLTRLSETAAQLNALARTLQDDVWTAGDRTTLILDAGTRYMAERLRQDLRGVVDEALNEFEARAKAMNQYGRGNR